MKKLSKFMMVVMVLSLTLFGIKEASAATIVDQQTTVKITQAYFNVSTNDITLKIPTTKEFSVGKPVWQLQNENGTWSDIVYSVTTPYFKGCSYGLGIKKYSNFIGKTYRLKMINSTLGVNYYTAPYTLTTLTKPSYSSYISLVN